MYKPGDCGNADEYKSYSPADAFEDGYTPKEQRVGTAAPEKTPSNILKYFEYSHLPVLLQDVSAPIGELAKAMDQKLIDGPEKSTGLRKLLEAKDCLVRARLG
ncbi:MAG: hypothetical protein V7731_24175 [Amphritea sp.]